MIKRTNLVGILLLGALGWSGCASEEVTPQTIDPKARLEARELFLSWSMKLERFEPDKEGNYRPSKRPADVLSVKGVVQDVDLPFLDTPSIAGERATATFGIKTGTLRPFPNCRTIYLRYDSYAKPFREGQEVVFLFLPDGRFWGIEDFLF